MPPADKKYWDEVAGENLRLYRMIQAQDDNLYFLQQTFTLVLLQANTSRSPHHSRR